ncbi:MAG: nitrilase-related carbon-nitrogen hydrolase [Thermodesulfobacteriota bacterium]
MKKCVKTAGIQLAPTPDREKNIEKVRELVGLAAKGGAQIVCLPQLFAAQWFPAVIDKKNFSLAEPEDGPTISALKELAAAEGVVLICPVFEKDGEDYFNTAFILGPGGGVIGKYRKVHVPQIPLWEERAYFKPGDLGFPVFETPFARVGVQLCWDVFFPEGMRVLALKGAEAVFAPTASAFYHSRGKWERAIRAAAHANGIFVFRVNRVGKELAQEFYGRSFCTGPDGEYVLKPCGSSEGVVLADLDLGEIGETRSEWVFLKDRRPGEYGEIVGKSK